MANVVLELKALTKKFGQRIATNAVSFRVHQGEIFGFLGANGAGKSTTIKMLTGLVPITSGDATVCGHSVKHHFQKAMENVGAIVEIPEFYGYLTGYQNLKYFAKLANVKNKAQIKKVVEIVGLTNRIHEKVSKYSLGMKQRLGVAQALLNSPKLLILDEPTNGLDANGIREFRFLLKNLAKREGIAILISSHILAEMQNLCDTIGIIDNGILKEVSPISKFNSIGFSKYIKSNAPNYSGKIIEQEFKIPANVCNNKVLFNANDQTLAKIIITLTERKVSVFGAGDVDSSLEDVFLSVVNRGKNNTGIR